MAQPLHPTLNGSLIVGFQGWFACPEDGNPLGIWRHWFTQNKPDSAHAHFDLMPDTSELTASERCQTGLTDSAGQPLPLFSDQNPKTVLRQFQWMHQYRIDGAALQRFLVDVDPTRTDKTKALMDHVLANVGTAAAQTGVGYYVMYDIAGADPKRWASILVDDWTALLASGITKSAAYQRHDGRPVLSVAGIGSDDRPGTAQEVSNLVAELRRVSAPYGGVTLIASTATGWRTRNADAKRDPAWDQAYASFDILSPWTVGRFTDAGSYATFLRDRLLPDMQEASRRGVGYMPVIFPGTSTHHLRIAEHHPAMAANGIPREGGRFLWMQAVGARKAGATMLYAAMFDEVDEGTALFKAAPARAGLPGDDAFLALDADGSKLPSDWYLRLCRAISAMLKGKAPVSDALPRSP